MSAAARAVPMASPVLDYAVALILGSHPASSRVEEVRRYVRAGASPRGLQALVVASQVRALLEGRYNVSVDDIRALAAPALRHRVLLNFEGQAEGISTDDIIEKVIDAIPVP
jgi:MoxR-like ATPase